MSEEQPKAAQLPPSSAIASHFLEATTENWFEYPVHVYPHQTDCAGIVWHGNYIAWMEEARVQYLRSIGVDYAYLVSLGCELPVVEMSLRYHRSLRMGMTAVVKTRIAQMKGVRLIFDYQIQSPDGQELYMTGSVTLVGIDTEQGKIMRKLPPVFQEALVKLSKP